MKPLIFRRLTAFLLLLSLLCSVSACGGTPPSDPSDGSVTVTDALGRELSVAKHPTRVAALLGSFADVWLLSGGTLCAAAEDAWEDFGLSLEGAICLGGAHSPSLEKLISSSPDLVLASASTASHVDMREPLESMGISVLYFDVDHFDDYLGMLKVCTELTERPDLYEANGLALKAQIDAVKADYAEAALPDSQRKILLLRAASSFVKAKGSRGTVLGEMLADMGCINIADSDESLLEHLSVEAVIRNEPYHIFAVTMGSDPEAARATLETMIKENPAWSSLGAVRNGRLHVMDKQLFNLKPNARWAESYRILYEALTSQ